MSSPPLLILANSAEYRKHYQRNYCQETIYTSDNIRVFFGRIKFDHAFYKNSQNKSGPKDAFDLDRAKRIDWVRATLESARATLYQGWNSYNKSYEENRRVSVLYEDFVVIIEMSINRQGELKANFITCYVADRSIRAIQTSPLWDKELCLQKLQEN